MIATRCSAGICAQVGLRAANDASCSANRRSSKEETGAVVSVVMRPLIHSKARCCAKEKYEQSLAFTIHILEAPYADPLQATRVSKTAQIAEFGPASGGHARLYG